MGCGYSRSHEFIDRVLAICVEDKLDKFEGHWTDFYNEHEKEIDLSVVGTIGHTPLTVVFEHAPGFNTNITEKMLRRGVDFTKRTKPHLLGDSRPNMNIIDIADEIPTTSIMAHRDAFVKFVASNDGAKKRLIDYDAAHPDQQMGKKFGRLVKSARNDDAIAWAREQKWIE